MLIKTKLRRWWNKWESFISFILQAFIKRKILLFSTLIIGITLPILYLTFKYQPETEAAWFNDSWAYRQTVNITNAGSAQTDFQVSIGIGTSALVNSGKIQSDCDDIRITDVNGKILPHWVQTSVNNCNSSGNSTTVWTKVPSIPISGITLYVYYGNPSAANAENGNNVFQFFDDFSGTTINPLKWPDQTGTWSVASGTLYSTTVDSAIHQANQSGSIVMETAVKGATTSTNARFGLADSNYTDYLSGAGNDGVFWHLWHNPVGSVYEDAKTNGNGTQYQSGSYSANTFNVYKISLSTGSSASFYQDNTLKQGIGVSVPSMDVGVWLSNDSTPQTTYDWVFTRKYSATEPTIAAPTNEEISPGPIAYFAFDEGYGTSTNDSSSTRLTGNITGASWQNEDKCISGKCLYFDGSDDEISISSAPTLTPSDNWSVSFWSKSDPSKTTWNGVMYLKAGEGWGIYARHSNNTPFLYTEATSTGATDEYFYGSTSFSYTNDWKHFVLTKSGTTYKWYVNGKLDNTENKSTGDVTNNTASTWKIGFSYSQRYKGFIDEVKVYKYARNAAQIKTEFAEGEAGAGAVKGTSASLGSKPQQYLSEGLVGHWKMDDNVSGNAKVISDSSGIGASAMTNYGANTTGMDCTVAGKYGKGCSLDGTDDYLDGGSNFNYTSESFTISYWIKLNSLTTNSPGQGPVPIYKGQYQQNGYYSQIGTTGGVSFVTSQSGANQSTSVPTGTITTGTWYQLTYVRNGSNVKIYVNGVDLTSTSATHINPTSSSDDFQVGMYATSINTNGYIDELRIYNRALSGKEVADLYNWAPGPKAYWKMDEGTSTSVYDSSGNSNNSTAFATPLWTTGKYGKGLKFDGNDNVTMPAVLGSGQSGPFTASMWIYPTATSTWNDFIGEGCTGLTMTKDGSNFKFGRNCGVPGVFYTATTLNTNTWYHVAAVYDGTNINAYVNGVYYAGGAVSFAHSTIYLGTYNGSNEAFNGKIDDVRIYDYARTQKQVVEDMNAGHPNVGSPVGSALGWWDFDEGVGATAYNSGSQGSALNANLGSGSSAPSWSMSGKFGKALSFDGIDALVSIPDSTALDFPDANFTLSTWFKTSMDAAENIGLITKYPNGPPAYSLHLDSNEKINCWSRDSNNIATTPISPLSYNDGSWHQAVCTTTTTGSKLYIDGKLVDQRSASFTGNFNNSHELWLGKGNEGNTSWDAHYNGLLDETKIYNYALTDDEVKLEYNRGSAQVLGTLSDNSSYDKQSANQEYCVPGDSTSCAAPIGRWDFEEGSGTAYDISGNGFNGTWSGTGTHYKAGKVGKSGNFTTSGTDYLQIAYNATLKPTTAITISYWVKFNSITDASARMTLSTTEGGGYAFQKQTNGDLAWRIHNGTDYQNSTIPAANFTANTWYHITGTYTSGSQIIYLNGKAIDTDTPTGSISYASSNPLCIGSEAGASDCAQGQNLDGQIDQLIIYNYVRTPAQVAWDYNRGGPVAYWDFDEGQGTTVYNFMGVGNTGAITIGSLGTQSSAGTITTASTAWGNGASGKKNYSLNFDGTDDHIKILDDSLLDLSSDMSVSAWVYLTNQNEQCLLHKGNGTVNGGALCYGFNSNGFMFIAYNAANSPYDTQRSTDINQWHHLVGVVQSGTRRLYIDGNFINSSSSGTSSWSNTNDLYIGSSGVPNYHTASKIDDVRVYNYALTATQVRELYNSGAVTFAPASGSP